MLLLQASIRSLIPVATIFLLAASLAFFIFAAAIYALGWAFKSGNQGATPNWSMAGTICVLLCITSIVLGAVGILLIYLAPWLI